MQWFFFSFLWLKSEFWPALIGAASAIATNAMSRHGADSQMEFQAGQSKTAYQRAVVDMQRAGLNPMLAYSQGGASTPVGAMPNVRDPVEAGMSSAQSYGAYQMAKQQVEQSQAQTELIKAQTAKTASETYDLAVNTAGQLARINLTEAQEKQVRALGRRTEAEVVGAHADSASKEAMVDKMSRGGGAGWEADVRYKKARALLAELGISEAQATSDFYSNDLGQMNPYLRQLLLIMQGASTARAATR